MDKVSGYKTQGTRLVRLLGTFGLFFYIAVREQNKEK